MRNRSSTCAGLIVLALAVVLLQPTRSMSNEKQAIKPANRAEQRQLDQLSDLLDVYCVKCHDATTTRGLIDLEKMLVQDPLVKDHPEWTNVYQRIIDGDMPPKKSKQPSKRERQRMADLVDRLVMQFDYASVATPGHEPVRRLTRREYSNTLQDLLGIDWDATEIFPDEMVGESGFDNSANTLFLQAGLMERFLTAADTAVDMALPPDATKQQWEHVVGEEAVKLPLGTRQAEASLAYFLPRAFRRPVSEAEAANAMEHYRAALKRGSGHEDALRAALKNTLIEAPFLMRMEAAPGRKPEPGRHAAVGPYGLASRLSYFLWSSMPDDELFRLAGERDPKRRLDDPAVLRSQIDRMLKDPRAMSLGTSFASQWLGFIHLGSRHRPDPIDMPEFTESLFESMRMESAHVFHEIITKNKPITEIIDADYTYVNEELARYYGWRNVRGEQIRRIKLPDKRRGGFITQASILMITAHPERTSPVIRGNWVLSELLGTPPPPPPPDVSEFSERIEEAELSLKRKMQLHSQKASCANCHKRIDPLGLALENFDQHGRWRARRGEGHGPRVQADGELPEGISFNGPTQFKAALLKARLDDLNLQISRKMLSYALGRQLTYTDEHSVRLIAKEVKASGYRTRALVEAVVQSDAFRYQLPPEPDGAQP